VGYLCPILVFLVLSVLDLGLMYATERPTSDAHYLLMLKLNAPYPRGGDIITARVLILLQLI